MSSIEELWSAQDDARLKAFVDAVAHDDLIGALHAIEGAPAQARASDALALQTWGRAVAGRAGEDAESQLCALEKVLGKEAGFAGDTEDYLQPANSHLHQVIERRRGLPILLSAIWMEVGRRAGLDVAGIGLPGHFLVQVGGADGPYADPFAGGAAVTLEALQQRVEKLSGGQLPWSDEFVRPVPLKGIVERVLRNLMNRYSAKLQLAEQYRTVSFLCALRPGQPTNFLKRAEVAEKLGATKQARADYAHVAGSFAESEEGKIAARWLGSNSGPALLH